MNLFLLAMINKKQKKCKEIAGYFFTFFVSFSAFGLGNFILIVRKQTIVIPQVSRHLVSELSDSLAKLCSMFCAMSLINKLAML